MGCLQFHDVLYIKITLRVHGIAPIDRVQHTFTRVKKYISYDVYGSSCNALPPDILDPIMKNVFTKYRSTCYI